MLSRIVAWSSIHYMIFQTYMYFKYILARLPMPNFACVLNSKIMKLKYSNLHGDYFKTGHPSFSLNNTLESKNLHYSQIAEDFPNSERCITFL